MYILGFPTDNEESIKKTISYAIKLNTEYAQFSIWTLILVHLFLMNSKII